MLGGFNEKTLRRTLGGLVAAGAAVALMATPVKAEFPEKPVEMTVLFGGSAKAIAHILADGMAKNLGEAVPTVSRTGGGGAVGYTYVKGTAPDGYNIVWNSNSVSTAHHKGNMPFDYTAFDPVARVSLEVPVMAVRADSPWKTLQEFMADAVKQPGAMKVGISGKGSFTHLTSAALFNAGGAQVTFVPYGKGRAPAELLGGRIDAALQWPSQFKSHADAGKLRLLAVTSTERIPLLPDVPTAKEQGYDVDLVMWRGVAAPKGTPKEAIMRLESAVKATVESDAFMAASKKMGFKPAFLGHAEFGTLIENDDKRISNLMGELGLKK